MLGHLMSHHLATCGLETHTEKVPCGLIHVPGCCLSLTRPPGQEAKRQLPFKALQKMLAVWIAPASISNLSSHSSGQPVATGLPARFQSCQAAPQGSGSACHIQRWCPEQAW